jgi:hypothetical protein
MLTPEKLLQLKKRIKSGYPEGELKSELQKEGLTQEEINEIFKPKPYDMRTWYLSFSILFFIGGMYVVLTTGGFFVLLFSVGLFITYLAEVKRVNKNN